MTVFRCMIHQWCSTEYFLNHIISRKIPKNISKLNVFSYYYQHQRFATEIWVKPAGGGRGCNIGWFADVYMKRFPWPYWEKIGTWRRCCSNEVVRCGVGRLLLGNLFTNDYRSRRFLHIMVIFYPLIIARAVLTFSWRWIFSDISIFITSINFNNMSVPASSPTTPLANQAVADKLSEMSFRFPQFLMA